MKKSSRKSEEETLRKRAEKLMSRKSKESISDNETYNLRLIHELEIHQIELEMQNEELALAQKTATDNAERYNQLYNLAPSGIFTLSKEGKILGVNLSGAELLGTDRNNLRNATFFYFVSVDTKIILNDFLEKLFAEDSKLSCELTLVLKHNFTKFIKLDGVKISENECLASVTDITDRKNSEIMLNGVNQTLEDLVKARVDELQQTNLTLHETEKKFRMVADFTYNWEFWLAPDDTILYCSPACKRITGYSDKAFMRNSKLLFQIIHPEDLLIFQNHREDSRKELKTRHEVQYRIIRADGQTRWIGHFCQPVYNEEGIFVGTRGSNIDITARKEIEKRLTSGKNKDKLLAGNITDGMFIWKEGRFEYVNRAMSDIFGYQTEELLKMKITGLALPDYHEKLNFFFNKRISTNKKMIMELESLKKDHSLVFVELRLNYLADENAIYGVFCDLTEQKQLQNNIIKAILYTEEKEKAKFSAEIHDGLGPLLSAIMLYVSLLEKPGSKDNKKELILRSVELLNDAITSVREISNKLSPHALENHGLSPALKGFINKLIKISNINIVFESNIARRFQAETEIAFFRAITEFINNSLKHSSADNILVRLNYSDNMIHLLYKDDGKGFDLENTLKAPGGFGLLNIKNRFKSLGGKILMASKPGEGVEYSVSLEIS